MATFGVTKGDFKSLSLGRDKFYASGTRESFNPLYDAFFGTMTVPEPNGTYVTKPLK